MNKNMDKKCEPGKILNPTTGKCVKEDGKIGMAIKLGMKEGIKSRKRVSSPKFTSSKFSSPRVSLVKNKKCEPGKILNPVSGKCVKEDGKIGMAIKLGMKSRKRVSSHRVSPVKNKKCEPGKILNPLSGKCVKEDGKIGLQIKAGIKSRKRNTSSPKTSYSKISLSPIFNTNKCKKGKILNPATGKCVKEDGIIGLKVKAGLITSPKRPSIKGIVNIDDDFILNPITLKKVYKHSRLGKKLLTGEVRAILKPAKYVSPDVRLSSRLDDCINRSEIELKSYQIKAVKYMKRNSSLLIVFGTGCGKTLTSVTISQCFLDKNPTKKVILVAPSTLLANFEKEMVKYGVQNKDRYEFYSFDKFSRLSLEGSIDMDGNMLIIDEVHNLRNMSGVRSSSVIYESSKAAKRVLLTATPFVNYYSDLIPIVNILYGDYKITGNNAKFDNVLKFLKNKVIVEDCYDPKFFPKRVDKTIEMEMTDDYYDRYIIETEKLGDTHTLFADPSKFYNGHRRAVNKLGPEYFSTKIKAVKDIIKSGKSIIYSNWLDYGVVPITNELKKNKVSYAMFTGEIPIKERKVILEKFNAGEIDVLIMSKVGGEGIDTKEVKSVIVVDPPWNDTGLHQIIGRAIRYNSHINLPKSERVVHVYFLKLTRPKILSGTSFTKTGDEIIYEIIEEKKKHNKYIMKELAEISI